MAEVLQSSPSHFSSPSSSSSVQFENNDGPSSNVLINREEVEIGEREGERDVLAILVSAFRKSLIGCSVSSCEDFCSMEIGVPTNVRHVAHVTFDRFHGFLGLPVEFEPEVPRRVPSASATVFGVSTQSMQLSYDTRGNSVPTILLMMQKHLYARGGLQAEGIFRINGENSHEEYVRGKLNRGIIPDDIDVHCLAGLIKAWFRELPAGVLDSLSSEQVMQSETEEECSELVRLLPPTESALLDWAVNLMADVAQMEHANKMNARNIAMVFAPNMTQMSDPLTALMYAVQVMNFLKTLVLKTLKERQDSQNEAIQFLPPEGSDRNDDHRSRSKLRHFLEADREDSDKDHEALSKEAKEDSETDHEFSNLSTSVQNLVPVCKAKIEQNNGLNMKKGSKRSYEERKGIDNVGRVNLRVELFEAWR